MRKIRTQMVIELSRYKITLTCASQNEEILGQEYLWEEPRYRFCRHL